MVCMRLILVLLGSTACSTRVHMGGMGSTGASAPDESAQLSIHRDLLVAGVAARGMAGPDQSTLAMGVEAAFPPGAIGSSKQPFSPHVALGVHALQLDWNGGNKTFGAGSPYAQVGGNICRNPGYDNDPTCIGLSFDAAYHLRFGTDNQVWLGGSLVLSQVVGNSHRSGPQKKRSKKKKKKRKNRRR